MGQEMSVVGKKDSYSPLPIDPSGTLNRAAYYQRIKITLIVVGVLLIIAVIISIIVSCKTTSQVMNHITGTLQTQSNAICTVPILIFGLGFALTAFIGAWSCHDASKNYRFKY